MLNTAESLEKKWKTKFLISEIGVYVKDFINVSLARCVETENGLTKYCKETTMQEADKVKQHNSLNTYNLSKVMEFFLKHSFNVTENAMPKVNNCKASGESKLW